ncbi:MULTISPECIES: MFS transporter [unclassified Streptomyces]|uniref:MFS transporter n=1 Tax=unclassified Streptomyces TaxID=2593676 RepID=UPI002DDB5060|nr:MFS transporter [Streptomyces sp. NBC_01775]WSB75246.1 MFS transporter [Streptomyces sp. NBC_01775]WSS45288.1 MFS transporter [Streptomyces sp. NBC_01187]
MPLALLALAIATFGAATAEFVMMGLLPEAASDMGVSIPDAGGYVSFYSLGVVIGAPLLTVAGLRVRRKTMLLTMSALFICGNVASAVASTHQLLLAARFLSGLPHGVFFGIGAVVAAGLVGPEKRGRALSLVLVGVPMANIVGSPLGTLLGQTVGWRWTFTVVAGIGVLGLVALALLLPLQPGAERGSVRGELGLFKRPQVWLAYAVVVFGFGGTASFYTYIRPLVTEVSGYTPTAATALLALSGAGMTVGTMLGGRLADRPLRTMCFALFTLAVSLAMFLFTAQNTVLVALNVFLTGIAGMAAIPSVQARILDHGGDAPELGSASVQSAFNIANSLGASLGGVVIAAGFGLTAPSTLGAMLSLAGAGFGLLAGWLDRGSRSWDVAASPPWKGVKSEALWPGRGGPGRLVRPARPGPSRGPPTGARKTGCPGERASDTLPPCTRITSFSDPGPRTRLDPLT